MKHTKRWLGIFLSVILCINMYAQNSVDGNLNYETFNVLLDIDKVGRKNFTALYQENSGALYLPIEVLFDCLKINNQRGENGQSVSGYVVSEKNTYSINYGMKMITYKNVSFPVSDKDMIYDMGILYVSKHTFEKIFGFAIKFDFRNLSAKLSADFEFPLVRQMKQESARANLAKLKGEVMSDVVLKRDYHLLRTGMADWSITSMQSQKYNSETRFGLGAGAEVFGGETDVWLNYSTTYGFNSNQQRYMWRWVDNNAKVIKQIQLGRIYGKSISSLLYPVDGATVSNTPTTVRKALGDYLISDNTEPDWLIELYINNTLMDYTRADASGFYSFKVPVVYGTTNITLRFYGPNGEEHSEQKVINMPYTFLPKGELEYRVSGGYLLDTLHSRYGRAEVSLGVTRGLTFGAGVEYSQTIISNSPYIPFVTASIQPFSGLILIGEYAHDVRTKATLNYTFLKKLTIDLNYSKYTKDQTAIIYNYKEERVANLSMPFQLSHLSGFVRGGFHQNIYSDFSYNAGDLIFSGYYKNVNINLSNFYNWTTFSNSPNVYSNLAIGYRLPSSCNIRLNGQYNYSTQKVISYKAEVEKKLFNRGLLTLGYENNFLSNANSVNISFKYDFSFMQTYVSSYFSRGMTQTAQTAQGSFAFGSGNKYVLADKQNQVGRSGISIIPYVDVNHNGTRDANEPFADNLTVKCAGGHLLEDQKDWLIRIVGLEPFVDYTLTLDESKFDNLSWKLKQKKFKVTTDPNQFKKIEIGVLPMGEVSGIVQDESGFGVGRVLVNITNESDSLVVQLQTESDGYFSYLGLAPGKYKFGGDSVQMAAIKKTVLPVSFDIRPTIEGDVKNIGKISLIKEDAKTSLVKDIVVNSTDIKGLSSSVLFKKGSSIIQTHNSVVLDKLVTVMKDNPYLNVNIDVDGNVDNNQSLTQKRIEAIKNYFAGQNVSSGRLTFISGSDAKKIESVEEKDNTHAMFEYIVIKNSQKSTRGDFVIYGYKTKYYLQIGAFLNPMNAENVLKNILKLGLRYETYEVKESNFYIIRMRVFSNKRDALNMSRRLFKMIRWNKF